MAKTLPASAFHFRDVLRAGDVASWPQGSGEPVTLTRMLMRQRHELPATTLFFGMATGDTVRPEHADIFTLRGLNGAGTNRRLAAAGVLDVIPTHVSSVPALLRSGRIRVDVALIQVRPHPAGGFTLGVIADYTQALIAHARVIVAQLDETLPLAAQDALVAASDIDILVEGPGEIIETPDPEPQAQDEAVARQVAALIPDRATLQLGIGAMPVAVARALAGHRDLGMHSGVVSDAVVDLIECGALTNAHKCADRGCTVTGGLFGTRRLYAWADRNPALSMRSVEYTHDLAVLRAIDRLYTVNGAIEVDLGGQVNAEVAAGRYLGAVGGQVDFVRGGVASADGRSIIALPATTADGKHSRIVLRLHEAAVTTARSDVDLVVTEFGVADLRGRSLDERARRLIAIADPRYREQLEAEWRAASPLARSAPGMQATQPAQFAQPVRSRIHSPS